jgi:tetratricopeptide (TPR) repeat protein
MRLLLVLLALGSLGLWAQDSQKPDNSAPANPPAAGQPAANQPANQPVPSGTLPAAKPAPTRAKPNLTLPSDSVNASELSDEPGQSSSKEDPMDLSPPADDARAHPKSTDAVTGAESGADGGGVGELHPWDPHKASKDVEVGDFYFKQKNYIGAESRYREALYYKDNDAVATFRLAQCLEKMNRPDEAIEEYKSYLKILPYGPEARAAKDAIERLKNPPASAKPGK